MAKQQTLPSRRDGGALGGGVNGLGGGLGGGCDEAGGEGGGGAGELAADNVMQSTATVPASERTLMARRRDVGPPLHNLERHDDDDALATPSLTRAQ